MFSFRFVKAALFAAGLTACSGGGGGAGAPTAVPQATSVPASESTATQSYPLSGNAQTFDLPSISAITGRVTLPIGGAVPPGTSLTVTTSLAAPDGTPMLPSAIRPPTSGQLHFLYFVTLSVSNSVTYPTLPGFKVTVAPAVSTAPPQQFFYAISNPAATNVALGFRTEGPATVSGQTLTFDASPSPLTLLALKRYTFAFYGTIGATPYTHKLYTTSDVDSGNLYVYDFLSRTYGQLHVMGSTTGPITVDASGNVYVAEDHGTYVEIFDTINYNGTPAYISGAELTDVTGLAVDASGKLYAANFANSNKSSVLVFDTLHRNAALPPITGLGSSYPKGVATAANGTLYVADYRTNSISVFDTAHGNAELAPIKGDGLKGPANLALDGSGKLFVTDASDIVRVFDTAHGNAVLPPITGAGLSGPSGVAVDPNGELYVANPATNSVLIFDTTHGNAELPPLTGLNHPAGLAIY